MKLSGRGGRPSEAGADSGSGTTAPVDDDAAAPTSIFDMSRPCVTTFDREKFERDGFWVWDGVMRPRCRAALTTALQQVQEEQDAMVMDECWTELRTADYAAMGLTPPNRIFSRAQRLQMVGSSQISGALAEGIAPLSEKELLATFTPHPRTKLPDLSLIPEQKYRQRMPLGKFGGVWPEHFPAGYNGHILDMVIHPEMLALHRLMLGNDLRYDHCVALNRKGGFRGQQWHSHGYTEDNQAPASRLPTLGLVRTLAYPEGFAAENDGGIRVVRGSALHRASDARFDDDDALRREWMAGKSNLITKEPLDIWAEALPPGSMVSIACHALHAVSPRGERGDPVKDSYLHRDSTRWCALFSYRNPDPSMSISPTSRGIPEPFRLAVANGDIAALRGEEKGYARRLFEPF